MSGKILTAAPDSGRPEWTLTDFGLPVNTGNRKMLKLVVMDDATHLIVEVQASLDPLKLVLGITAVVRRWGTTQGRGELCLKGPTANTIIDMEPPGGELILLHVRRIIPVTKEAEEKWRQLIGKQ